MELSFQLVKCHYQSMVQKLAQQQHTRWRDKLDSRLNPFQFDVSSQVTDWMRFVVIQYELWAELNWEIRNDGRLGMWILLSWQILQNIPGVKTMSSTLIMSSNDEFIMVNWRFRSLVMNAWRSTELNSRMSEFKPPINVTLLFNGKTRLPNTI